MKIHALILAALVGAAIAEDKKPSEPVIAPKAADPVKPAETPKPADPAAPAEVKIYAPTDLEKLKPLKGQKIVIEGTISGAGANKGETIRYLNFTKDFRQSVSLVFFSNLGNFSKEKLAEFVGKKVQANGTLSDHNGALQIKVESLDQIKVQTAPPAQP